MLFPVTQKTSRAYRKRGKTAVITTSLYKQELEEIMKRGSLRMTGSKPKKEKSELKNFGKKVW